MRAVIQITYRFSSDSTLYMQVKPNEAQGDVPDGQSGGDCSHIGQGGYG